MTPEGFSPVSICDVMKLRYCTFCFKCNIYPHHKCSGCEEFVRKNPSYWPNGSKENFERTKCLTFVYVKCCVDGCGYESWRPSALKNHLVRCHNRSSPISGEIEMDLYSTNSNSLVNEEKSECVPTPPENSSLITIDSDDSEKSSILSTDSKTKKSFPLTCAEPVSYLQGSESDSICLSPEQGFDIASSSTSSKVDTSTPPLILDTTAPSASKGSYITGKKTDIAESIPKHEDESGSFQNTVEKGKAKKFKRTRKTEPRRAYKCGFCTYETVYVPNIKAHYLSLHSVDKIYFCKPCFFVSHNQYTRHVHSKSRCNLKNSGAAVSPIDLQEFKKTGYNDIKEGKAEIITEIMEDDIPGKSQYVNGEEANEGLAHNEYFHSALDNFSIKCVFCTFSTKYTDSMKSHVNAKHVSSISLVIVKDGVLVYECRHCEEYSEKRSFIASHYLTKHMEYDKLFCEACDLNFRDIRKYKEHLKSERHKLYYRRSYRCNHCGFGSYSGERLMKHKRNVHGKNHKCDLCSFTTKWKCEARRHLIKRHFLKKGKNGAYNCDQCPVSTINKDALYSHLIKAGHEHNAETFICDKMTL